MLRVMDSLAAWSDLAESPGRERMDRRQEASEWYVSSWILDMGDWRRAEYGYMSEDQAGMPISSRLAKGSP
jgi:hypothetical protein